MAEIQLQSSDGTVEGNIFINGSGELALREGGGGSQVLLGDNALELPSVDLKVTNGNLDVGGSVFVTGNLSLATGQGIEDGSGNNRVVMNSGATELKGETGTDYIAINDSAGIIQADTGRFDISIGSANLRLATGQAIEDGGGNKRIGFSATRTAFYTETEKLSLVLDEGNRVGFNVGSNEVVNVYDGVNSQTAYQYDPATTQLELTNADLDASGQSITTDSLNGADIANASTDDVPVSNGDGTLSMGSISHSDVIGKNSDDHHTKYQDSEARGAIESGNVSQVSFANIESVPSRSIGIDDSEGPMYADSSGNNYPLWNSKGVNSGSGVSISGGNGAGSTPVTIGLNESNINHNNLNNSNDSDAHHTKTTSASDLTDVSADSVSDAHHAQNHGDSDHEYTLKINGTVIGSGDTVNFKT